MRFHTSRMANVARRDHANANGASRNDNARRTRAFTFGNNVLHRNLSNRDLYERLRNRKILLSIRVRLHVTIGAPRIGRGHVNKNNMFRHRFNVFKGFDHRNTVLNLNGFRYLTIDILRNRFNILSNRIMPLSGEDGQFNVFLLIVILINIVQLIITQLQKRNTTIINRLTFIGLTTKSRANLLVNRDANGITVTGNSIIFRLTKGHAVIGYTVVNRFTKGHAVLGFAVTLIYRTSERLDHLFSNHYSYTLVNRFADCNATINIRNSIIFGKGTRNAAHAAIGRYRVAVVSSFLFNIFSDGLLTHRVGDGYGTLKSNRYVLRILQYRVTRRFRLDVPVHFILGHFWN